MKKYLKYYANIIKADNIIALEHLFSLNVWI